MTNELFEAYKGQLSPKEARAFSERVTRMTPQQKQQLSNHLGTMFHEIRNKHIKPKEDMMMTAQIGGEFKASDMFVPTIEGEKISYEGLVPVDQQTYVVRDQPTRNPVPQAPRSQRTTQARTTQSKAAPQTSKVGVPAMLARPQEQPVKLSSIQDLPRAKTAPQDFNRTMTGAITSIPQERTNKFKKVEVEGESLLLDPATGYAYSRNPNGTYRVKGNFETPSTPQPNPYVTAKPGKESFTPPKRPSAYDDSMGDPESAVVNYQRIDKDRTAFNMPLPNTRENSTPISQMRLAPQQGSIPSLDNQTEVVNPSRMPYSPSIEQPYNRYRMVDDFTSPEIRSRLEEGRIPQDYATPDTYTSAMNIVTSSPQRYKGDILAFALRTPGLTDTEKENLIYEGVERGEFSVKNANEFLKSNRLPPIIDPIGIDFSNPKFGRPSSTFETKESFMADRKKIDDRERNQLEERNGEVFNTLPYSDITSGAAFYYVAKASDPEVRRRRMTQVGKYIDPLMMRNLTTFTY